MGKMKKQWDFNLDGKKYNIELEYENLTGDALILLNKEKIIESLGNQREEPFRTNPTFLIPILKHKVEIHIFYKFPRAFLIGSFLFIRNQRMINKPFLVIDGKSQDGEFPKTIIDLFLSFIKNPSKNILRYIVFIVLVLLGVVYLL
jgi:hypothetical protein